MEYFKLKIPKVIKSKRMSNKIIKLLDNMSSFKQKDYEYDSLHIFIKNVLMSLFEKKARKLPELIVT